MTRVIYKEINNCKECHHNKNGMCYHLSKPLKSLCYELDCTLPHLAEVEQYTKYVNEDNSVEVCGNCTLWRHLAYSPFFHCDLGKCEKWRKRLPSNKTPCHYFHMIGDPQV